MAPELKSYMALTAAILLLYFGMSGLWIINDLMSGLHFIIQTRGITPPGTTNGFIYSDYVQSFHIGLWAASGSLIFLALLAGNYILHNMRKKE